MWCSDFVESQDEEASGEAGLMAEPMCLVARHQTVDKARFRMLRIKG